MALHEMELKRTRSPKTTVPMLCLPLCSIEGMDSIRGKIHLQTSGIRLKTSGAGLNLPTSPDRLTPELANSG
eukprot:scaffold203111_cov18-Tisochrysis_lutea.AAC.1